MTLFQISFSYEQTAAALSERIAQLNAEAKQTEDRQTKNRCRQRVAELRPLLQEARELCMLTRHYYDKGYHKHGKYAL